MFATQRMLTKGAEHPERRGTVRHGKNCPYPNTNSVLSGNMAPASALTGITGLSLQLHLPTEVGGGFIIFSSQSRTVAGSSQLASGICHPRLQTYSFFF